MRYRNFLLFILSLLFVVPASGQAFINDVPPNLCPDQEVEVMERVGDTVYMGGSFSYIGARKPHLAVLDSAIGSGLQINDYPDGPVHAVVSDGQGGWIIGGEFTRVGSQSRPNIAQIDSAGNLTAWNPSTNGEVRALMVYDSVLYVGGRFTSIASSSRLYAAAFDLNTLAVSSWNTSILTTTGGEVKCFKVKGDTLYLGGLFNYASGANLIGVSRNTGQTVHLNLPRPNSVVYGIHILNNTLYVVGSFTSVSQILPSASFPRNRAGAVDLSTNLVNSWNPNLNSLATCITDDGTDIIIGGLFGTVQSITIGTVAAVDPVSGTATTNPINNIKPYGAVWVLNRQGNILYVGGKFTKTMLSHGGALFAYNLAIDSVISSWTPTVGTGVLTFAKQGNKIGVGGEFVTSNAVRRDGLCAFRFSDHQLLSWNPQLKRIYLTPEVLAIDVEDTLVYIGGYFDSIDGQVFTGLAALDRLTALPTSWAPQILYSNSPLIQTVLVDNGTIYFGGVFTSVNGQPRANLAAVDNSGNLLPWNPNANINVRKIVSAGPNIITVGSFSQMNSQTRKGIALFDKATLTLSSWNPNPDIGSISDVAVDSHRIYITGAFTLVSGQARLYHAAYDQSPIPQLSTWGTNVYFDNSINRVYTTYNSVYFWGSFTNVNNLPRHHFASCENVTGSINSLALPCFPTTVFSPIFPIDDRIYLSKIIGSSICEGQPYTLVAYRTATNIITGTAFFDNNQNGTQDILELVRPNQVIELQPNSDFVTTDQNGFYSFFADTGMFSVAPVLGSYYPSSIPALHQPYFSSWQSTDSLNDFGLYAIPGVHDLVITLTPTSGARLGSDVTFLVTYKNAGTVTKNGFLTVVLPQYISFVNSPVAPAYYNMADSVQWNYTNLLPGEQRQLTFRCHIGVQNIVGSSVVYHAQIDSIAQDTTPSNNIFTCSQTITASYDPNCKAVFPEDSIQPVTFNESLSFNVHFQNTGNDTALNIVVLDTLNPYLDIHTFEFLGNSHACTWAINNRILRVTFDQIMLPDSTTDFEGSQGFFTYRMKPILPVFEGEIIPNTAAIYFDYNDAVITNTTNTIFTSLIITSNSAAQSNTSFSTYPNPAKDQLTVSTKGIGLEVGQYEVIDLAGNLIMKGTFEKSGFIISMPSIENGIYLLTIRAESGETGNLKFVICR